VKENVDRTDTTEKELQTELAELTNQYKRLKEAKKFKREISVKTNKWI
jgi:hypothetical protein